MQGQIKQAVLAPKVKNRNKIGREAVALTTVRTKEILALLYKESLCRREIQERTGLYDDVLTPIMAELKRKPNNLIYIIGWKPYGSGRNLVAIWSAGFFHEDKPSPKLSNILRRLE